MALSKLDFAIVAFIAGGMLWVEHGHRIKVEAPIAAEVSGPAASACPDNDSVPFSADCIAFIGSGVPAVRTAGSTFVASAAAHGQAESSCPPNNENAPYSANCIRFLSGWYWHPDPAENAPR
jgi:hypothetical protein